MIATVFVFAHFGHWGSSVLILVPTLAFILWLVASTIRERRRERGQ